MNAPKAFRARVNLYLRFGLHVLHSQQQDFDMALSIFYSVVEARSISAFRHPVIAAACILYCARLCNTMEVGRLHRVQICKAYVQAIEQKDIEDNYLDVMREYQMNFLNMMRPDSQRDKLQGLPSTFFNLKKKRKDPPK